MEQRATYIACMMGGHWLSDEVAAMRKEPNWTFRTIDTGHWPMVSTPDRLVALLAEVALEHSEPAGASDQALQRATAPR